MKTNTITRVRVDEKLLHEIQQEVKETLAVDMAVREKSPVFCAADLWKIHNLRKQRSVRRFL